MSFNGFISYSHAADGRLAPAVQRGLHRLAKPWYRRRALWIFRDQTGLAVTHGLWSSIQDALDRSDYFVLLASPEAAGSRWVNREIEHWVSTKSADRILPVVTDGEWRWDPETRDFDAASTAVPPALRGVFADEPLFLDLRWARHSSHLSLRHSRFRDAVAQLAAPMHGVSKDELEGEDVRQHRRAGRLRWAAVTSLVMLTVLASVTGMAAVRNAAQANASALEARRQERVASEQRGSAARFAGEAQRQEELAREQEKRAVQAAAEADRQERLAGRASAEAGRQLGNADRAAARAREQQRLARRQSELARESAREMRRQEQRAKEQESLARQQERLAVEAGAEADRQREFAQDQKRLAAEAGAEARDQEKIAQQQERRAEEAGAEAARQQRSAISRRLVNEARAGIDNDPQQALRLGVAAHSIDPEAQTRRAVAGVVTSTRYSGTVGKASDVVYGPRGLLVTVNDDGTVSLWDTRSQPRPVRLATVGKPSREGYSVALSRDGRMLAARADGAVTLWNVANPARPRRTAALPADRLYNSVAFAPDGRALASGDVHGTAEHVTLWDVTDGTRPRELSRLTGKDPHPARSIAFSGDGRTLVAQEKDVLVWDVTDRARPVLRSEIVQPDYAAAIAVSSARPILVVADSVGTLVFYDLTNTADPQRWATMTGHTGPVHTLSFDGSGRVLASGDWDGAAIVWELEEFIVREIGRISHDNGVDSLALSADGRILASADYTRMTLLWNVQEHAAPQLLSRLQAQRLEIRASSYGRDGRSLITAGADGTAVFWDVTNRARPRWRTSVAIHGGANVDRAAISRNGRIIVAAGMDQTVTVTDVSNPTKPSRLPGIVPGVSWVGALTVSPDGRTVAVGGNGKLELWQLNGRAKPIRSATLTLAPTAVGPVTFSPDGRTLAVTSVHLVSLWDLGSPGRVARLATLTGHGNGVETVAFSPDGRTVATGGFDKGVILWNISDRTRPHRTTTLTGHHSGVAAVAFSTDGKTVATVGADPWVMVWDVAQPSEPFRLATFKTGSMRATGAAFSPDGNTLAVSTVVYVQEGNLGIWDVTELNRLRGNPARLGCRIAGGGLSAQEWARHIPELPYRRTCAG